MSTRYVNSDDHGKAPQEHLALAVLARLVRDEFPADLSLAEIAYTWGNATQEEADALKAVEASLEER